MYKDLDMTFLSQVEQRIAVLRKEDAEKNNNMKYKNNLYTSYGVDISSMFVPNRY